MVPVIRPSRVRCVKGTIPRHELRREHGRTAKQLGMGGHFALCRGRARGARITHDGSCEHGPVCVTGGFAFAYRLLWNVAPRPPGQSALMPVNFTTLPHFSVSSAMSLPKSAGESASTSPPRSARRAFILGSARPALISVLSFSTISAGVAFGAPTPYQVLTS